MTDNAITVTGASGFVGRRLVAMLRTTGRRLNLVVRDGDSCPPAWIEDPDIEIVECPDLSSSDLRRLPIGAGDSIIHLAGLAHKPGAPPDAYRINNVVATQRLAAVSAAAGIDRFIYVSSLHAVRDTVTGTRIDDSATPDPVTPYGRSKREAEQFVGMLADKGITAIALRPCVVIGSQAAGNWQKLQRLAASGLPLPFASLDHRRSLCSRETLAGALTHLATRPLPDSATGAYLIADEPSLTLPQILTFLRQGMNIAPRLFSVPRFLLSAARHMPVAGQSIAPLLGSLEIDPSRFYDMFGYSQPTDLGEAIRLSGAGYLRPEHQV